MTVLWPSSCPVCASRKVFVYVETGEWFCASCDVDSGDTEPTDVGPEPANR